MAIDIYQQEIQDLLSRVTLLETKAANHRHLGTDASQLISLPTVARTAFGGLVQSNAAGTPFPSGWTVSHPSTGNYQIVHGLTVNYSVVVTMIGVGFNQIFTHASDRFNVNTKNTSVADADFNFFFVVVTQS